MMGLNNGMRDQKTGRATRIEALKARHRAALAEADALFTSLQQRAFARAL